MPHEYCHCSFCSEASRKEEGREWLKKWDAEVNIFKQWYPSDWTGESYKGYPVPGFGRYLPETRMYFSAYGS